MALWSLALTGLLLGPALGPGFTLSYDMVAVPRQDLLPASLGLGGGLPRAVPQDAVVAILDSLLPGAAPGMWLQKALLVAIGLLAGWGVARLIGDAPLPARLLAATLAVWNPLVVERLVLGHATFLLAYALVPWALAQSLAVRRGIPGAGPRLVLLLAAAALTPGGALLAGLVALPPALLPGSAATPWRRGGIAAAGLAVWLPWLIPALLNPAAAQSAGGAAVFALRAEGPWGPLLTAVGGGGVWNADVVPASRGWWTAPLLAVAVAILAVIGARSLRTSLGTAVVAWWGGLAIAGLLAALASDLVPGAWTSLVEGIAGAGLLRDAQRLLAPLVLLLAAAAPLGAAAVLGRIRDTGARGAAWAGVILAPIALLPDAAGGVSGRLAAVDYPPEWAAVRSVLASDPRPGDVIVVPWASFRRFAWNDDRTVLDPAPRWLPRTAIAADSLIVATPEGPVVIGGEDPRADAVEAALAARIPLAGIAPGLGAGWVLVEEGQVPELAEGALEGLEPVLREGDLTLWRVPGAVVEPPLPPGAPVVVAADLAVLGLLAGLLGILVTGGLRRRRLRLSASPPGSGPPLVA